MVKWEVGGREKEILLLFTEKKKKVDIVLIVGFLSMKDTHRWMYMRVLLSANRYR
jgi:hypothetical protein